MKIFKKLRNCEKFQVCVCFVNKKNKTEKKFSFYKRKKKELTKIKANEKLKI